MHTPRKRFGQHFLSDQYIIMQIIQALAPAQNDNLVEIGPGQGALTVPVMRQVHQLSVIELDRDLIPELQKRCDQYGKLTVYSADVLKFDFTCLQGSSANLRVFGNLPYNISTPLLFHLLTYAGLISDMLFMLQKEVAHRIAAKTNESEYGRLSVMVQYYCKVELLFDVPASAFYPPPQVTSSIVRLTPIKVLERAEDEELFAEVVRLAFGQRRKTLRNSLKNVLDDDDWAHMPLRSDLRPENLSVGDFVALSNLIARKVTN